MALAIKAIGATLEHIQSYFFTKAINCSWNPTINPLIIDGYIVDGPRPGRKPKKVTSDRYGREKSCAYIAAECGYSTQTTIKDWKNVIWSDETGEKKPKAAEEKKAKENGAIKRTAKKGSINWYRYLTKCLLPQIYFNAKGAWDELKQGGNKYREGAANNVLLSLNYINPNKPL
ncbi:uncharacterized protein K441DRAFT_650213, partial [Cenococcum geophilum 1.58]|uniref:uncharacterized protein n=1 Tax=Cenococcum geophilum 1.58 TaxID=794803 RepID=UPI00358E8371